VGSSRTNTVTFSWSLGYRLTFLGLWLVLVVILVPLALLRLQPLLGDGPWIVQLPVAAGLVGLPLLALLLLRRVWLWQQLRLDPTGLSRLGFWRCRRVSWDQVGGVGWEQKSHYSPQQQRTFFARVLRLEVAGARPLLVAPGGYAARDELARTLEAWSRGPAAGQAALADLLARRGRPGRPTPRPIWPVALALFCLGTTGLTFLGLADRGCTATTLQWARQLWDEEHVQPALRELAKLDACGPALAAPAAELRALMFAEDDDCAAAAAELARARELGAEPGVEGLLAQARCASDEQALRVTAEQLTRQRGRPCCEVAVLLARRAVQAGRSAEARELARPCATERGCWRPAGRSCQRARADTAALLPAP